MRNDDGTYSVKSPNGRSWLSDRAVEIADGFLAMKRYCPPDLVTWTRFNWHWNGHP